MAALALPRIRRWRRRKPGFKPIAGHKGLSRLERLDAQRRATLDLVPQVAARLTSQPKRVPVFVLGMSHISAVEQALERSPDPAFALWKVGTKPRSGNRIISVNRFTLGLYRPDRVVSMLSGNQHVVLSLIEYPEPFDFEHPAVPTLLEDRRVVPQAQPRRLLERQLADVLTRLNFIRDFYHRPMAHVASPPPIVDPGRRKYGLLNSPFVQASGRPAVVAPGSLRLKFYHLQNEILREHCEKEGIRFIEPPAAALRDDGLLDPRFARGDHSHANAAYGALVLDDIRAFANETDQWMR